MFRQTKHCYNDFNGENLGQKLVDYENSVGFKYYPPFLPEAQKRKRRSNSLIKA